MEFLGVGPLEFLFITLIVILLFSPKDIAGGAKTFGRTLNRLYKSENYKILQKTSEELRHLPQRLAREANLEETQAQMKPETPPAATELKSAVESPFQAWTPPVEAENRIAPPRPPSAPPTDKPATEQ